MPGLDSTTQDIIDRDQRVLQILQNWGLAPDAQIALLGCQNELKPRDLTKIEKGTKTLPDNEKLAVRIEHIIGIAEALHTSYPSRPEAGVSWMRQRNGKLRGRTPVQCLLQDGVRGLVKVRVTVDCAWGWHQDDKHNPCWD